MRTYLVHGHGFAEIEKASSPIEAIRQFRCMAQKVNPDMDLFALQFVAEPINDGRCDEWDREFRMQHQMAFGLTDEFD